MNTYCLLDELKVLVLHYSNLFHDMNYFLLILWHGSSEVINVEVNDNSPDLLHLFETEDSMVSYIARC